MRNPSRQVLFMFAVMFCHSPVPAEARSFGPWDLRVVQAVNLSFGDLSYLVGERIIDTDLLKSAGKNPGWAFGLELRPSMNAESIAAPASGTLTALGPDPRPGGSTLAHVAALQDVVFGQLRARSGPDVSTLSQAGAAVVPEPSASILFGSALTALFLVRRRRRR